MNKTIALEWLKAANDDLMLILNIIENAELTHLAAFHCQQSIEKSFKAILEYNGSDVPKKHDLLLLKDLVSEYFNVDNEEMLETLNGLYVDSRYPGNLGLLPNGKPTIEDAKEFYDFAKNIHSSTRRKIENK